MIQEHFLYSTMIEGDGHLRNEPTIAGCALIVIAALIIGYIALTLFAFI